MKFLPLLLASFLCSSCGHADCASDLARLEKQIEEDLYKIDIPFKEWVIHDNDYPDVLDVAIIGGGMSGLCCGFALVKEGITNIKIFDENPLGKEGIWNTSARMEMLRSSKHEIGPALDIPSLTLSSWYQARYGKEAWDQLQYKCPTKHWHEYLTWYRQVLKLPCENEMKLKKIIPLSQLIELQFECSGQTHQVLTRKVVLATGRAGSGPVAVPDYLKKISKAFYAHTNEQIDPQIFSNRRVAVIGAASSAFDAAGTALENGALRVDMLVRRPVISNVNKAAPFAFPGSENGYHLLSDDLRCFFMAETLKNGAVDPTKGSIDRIKDFRNIHFHYDTEILDVTQDDGKICIQTSHGILEVDYLISATGFCVDLSKKPELDFVSPYIELWKPHVPGHLLNTIPKLGSFPYLGAHYQFIEKTPGEAPYLRHLYCFNYAALLSHGFMSSAVPGLSLGATRLAKGIAADFFVEESSLYLKMLTEWKKQDFCLEDYPVLYN